MSELFMEWRPEYSVGIETIDDQHRVLLGLLNQLHEALQNGRAEVEIHEVLDALTDYTRTHFLVEEAIMEVVAYSQFEEHKAQHRKLLQQVRDFRGRVRRREAGTAEELLEFLKQWLIQHILKEDMQYADHFALAKQVLGRQGAEQTL